MRILAISDVHGDLRGLRALREREGAADLLLVCGDLTHGGGAQKAAAAAGEIAGLFPDWLAVPGNMDRPEVLSFLQSVGRNLHGAGFRRGPVGLAGVGACPPTPFSTPFELPDDTLGALFETAAQAVDDCPVRVFVSHAPPKDTALDRVRAGFHVGSAAVRRVVESRQPHVLVCGHIHESGGQDRLGRTLAFNPGPLSGGGYVRLVISGDGSALEAELLRL